MTDRDAFITSILASLDIQMPASQNPGLIKKDIELLYIKDRYQEIYANDIMTIDELKDKVTVITEELDMDLDPLALSKKIVCNAEDLIRRYTEEIHRFLELETVINWIVSCLSLRAVLPAPTHLHIGQCLRCARCAYFYAHSSASYPSMLYT